MKLKTIYEAYDKNLGNSIAKKYDLEPTAIKAWVQAINPNYTYAPWILKQLKENTPTNRLQDQLKTLITKFKNATEHTPEILISTDINKYTLESLRSALDTYQIKGEFEPESLNGVRKIRDYNVTQGYGTTEGVETRIRAYLITDHTSLTQLSKDKGWCVKATDTAKKQLAKTPVIMIFRNNEATALGDIIGPQLMNSQNKTETRPEIVQLIQELKNDDNIMKLLSKNPGWAYRYASNVIEGRWPEGEQAISKDPYYAYTYARNVIRGRWPEAEPTISTDPELAYEYALYTIKKRWPEGEPTIIKNPHQAYEYARYIIKGRWPEAEESISTNPGAAYYYALIVIGGSSPVGLRRWPEAEETISKDPYYAYEYARNFIGGRWPEAEETISKNPEYAHRYAQNVIKGRWPEAEETISKDPSLAYYYAKNVIEGRWPEAEPTIIKDPKLAYEYALYVIKGPWPEAGIIPYLSTTS